MAKYHINPTTGEVGACRAQKGNCPFSSNSEHFDSKDEARHFYESVMEGKQERPLSWLLSKRGDVLTGPEANLELARELYDEREALKALHDSKEFWQVQNYAITGFERVNALLRGLPLDASAFEVYEDALERTQKQIAVMDRIFASASPKPRTVYRFTKALEGQSVADAVEGLKRTGTFTDPAFISTSASVDYPLYEILEHPEDKLFLLEIATREGIALQPKAHHQPGHVQSMENEVLLPRNMKFSVAGVEPKKKVAFGGMKPAILAHANIQSRKLRHRMEDRPHHILPVVKLVQE